MHPPFAGAEHDHYGAARGREKAAEKKTKRESSLIDEAIDRDLKEAMHL
jgi:hypothetical protein